MKLHAREVVFGISFDRQVSFGFGVLKGWFRSGCKAFFDKSDGGFAFPRYRS